MLRSWIHAVGVVVLVCTSFGCASGTARGREREIISLLGKPLYSLEQSSPTLSRGRVEALERDLVDATEVYAADPMNPIKLIWVGRRLGYLWRLREAVTMFSQGIVDHPNHAALYRHRGHRYISMRLFDRAIEDLEAAAGLIKGIPDEIEPDGMPNREDVPLTTTGLNVWYHLALARYLTGDFDGALRGWRQAMGYARNLDDNIVAVTDWTYMTLRRLGRDAEASRILASITPDMEMIENTAYHRRLLMYKGIITPDELLNLRDASDLDVATLGYGLGNWYLYHGDIDRAKQVFQRVVEGPYWPAFGYIASEVELWRLRRDSYGGKSPVLQRLD